MLTEHSIVVCQACRACCGLFVGECAMATQRDAAHPLRQCHFVVVLCCDEEEVGLL